MHDVIDGILQLLHAGGSAALIVMAGIVWRLDRRIYRLELLLHPELKGKV